MVWAALSILSNKHIHTLSNGKAVGPTCQLLERSRMEVTTTLVCLVPLEGSAGRWARGRVSRGGQRHQHCAMEVSWREPRPGGAEAGAPCPGLTHQRTSAWRSQPGVTAACHRHRPGWRPCHEVTGPVATMGPVEARPGPHTSQYEPRTSRPQLAWGCPAWPRPPRPGGATPPGPEETALRLRGWAREAGPRGRAQARDACALGPRAGLVVAALRGLAAWRVRPPRRPEGTAGPPRLPPPAAARRGAGPGTPRSLPPAPPEGEGRLRGSDPRPLAPGWDS